MDFDFKMCVILCVGFQTILSSNFASFIFQKPEI